MSKTQHTPTTMLAPTSGITQAATSMYSQPCQPAFLPTMLLWQPQETHSHQPSLQLLTPPAKIHQRNVVAGVCRCIACKAG
jgi:hypothetical protein